MSSTNLEMGIVGLPNVGKSTLFNAITKAGAEAANYPFCTIEPNVGVVDVPDARLKVLSEMFHSKKIVPAGMRFVDIAGLVKGASKGEGLGNKFLSHIRQTDAIAEVVRCFEDGNITHVEGSIDPVRDVEIINTELCLADLDSVDKQLVKVQKLMKSGDKKAAARAEVLKKISAGLGDAVPARRMELTEDEKDAVKELDLLTLKPILYVANVSEEEAADASGNPYVKALEDYAAQEHAQVIVISAKVEEEIAELPEAEAKEYLEMEGLTEAGLDRLIKAGFKLLGLQTFLTAGEMESRAWTIVQGSTAPQAAGKIHSDFEKGFIRAEIVSYEDLVKCGSKQAAKEKGLVRLEGKDYIMQDGDVVEFRFLTYKEMTTMLYDTHTHADYSCDAEMTLPQAIERAKALNIGLILTEHWDRYYPTNPEMFLFDIDDYFRKNTPYRTEQILLASKWAFSPRPLRKTGK